jgi:hypothetical protein
LCKQQLQSFQQCALYYLFSLNFLFHRGWKLLHCSVLLIFPIEGIRYFIPFLPQNNVIGIHHSEPQCSPRSASTTSRCGFGTTRKACIMCKFDERRIILWNWIQRSHKHLLTQPLANTGMVTTCTATPWPCSKHIARRLRVPLIISCGTTQCRVKCWIRWDRAKKRKRKTGNTEANGRDFVHLLT